MGEENRKRLKAVKEQTKKENKKNNIQQRSHSKTDKYSDNGVKLNENQDKKHKQFMKNMYKEKEDISRSYQAKQESRRTFTNPYMPSNSKRKHPKYDDVQSSSPSPERKIVKKKALVQAPVDFTQLMRNAAKNQNKIEQSGTYSSDDDMQDQNGNENSKKRKNTVSQEKKIIISKIPKKNGITIAPMTE